MNGPLICLRCKEGYKLLSPGVCEPTPEGLENCRFVNKFPRPNKGEFTYYCHVCDEGYLMLEDGKCKSINDTDYPVKLPTCASSDNATNFYFGFYGLNSCICKDGSNPPCAGGAIMRVILGLFALFTTSMVVF